MLKTLKKNFIFCIVLMQCVACNQTNNKAKQELNVNKNVVEKPLLQGLLNDVASEMFKHKAAEKQQFFVAAKSNTTVTAKNGFSVAINTANLCNEDGTSLGNENVQITIEELLNTEALLAANATTVSNGKMLISGGSYNINIQQNNKAIKIKPNASLSIKVPKLKNQSMQLFYGKREENGFVNWQATNQSFAEPIKIKKSVEKYTYLEDYKVSDTLGKRPATFAECFMLYKDSVMKSRWAYTIANRHRLTYHQEIRYGLQPIVFPMKRFMDNAINIDSVSRVVRNCFGNKLVGKDYTRLSYMYLVTDTFPVYKKREKTEVFENEDVLSYFEPVEIEQLGWINVDKFYNVATCDSTMLVFNNGIMLDNYKVYYKFKNINSVLAESNYNVKKTSLIATTKLPLQEAVEVIVVGTINNKIYTGKATLQVQRKNKVAIALQQMKKETPLKV